jgi:hypothetical protein
MLVSVAVAQNESEAQMICGRLENAGIRASYKRPAGRDVPQMGVGGIRDVYVDQADVERALETLAVPAFTDEELAQLAEQSPPPPD